MIVWFAQFGKQLRQLKKYLQKTASKKQWTKHEKSSKKGFKIESKIMKKRGYHFTDGIIPKLRLALRGSYFFCAKELVVCASRFLDPGSLGNRPFCL